jgi:hypothetical protein
MTKIAIFYHIYQYGDWENVFKEQFEKLKSSGLLDAASFVYFGISGEEPISLSKEDYDKIEVVQRFDGDDRKRGEAPTVHALYDFCLNKTENWNVLYLHTKGVTWSTNLKKKVCITSDDELEIVLSDVNNPKHKLLHTDFYKNIIKWRNYLEFFLIEKWRKSVDLLNVPSFLTQDGTHQTYDTVGTEWLSHFAVNELGSKHAQGMLHNLGHYSGNMWWANSTYIKRLSWNFVDDTSYFFDGKIEGTRFLSEAWIGTGKPTYYNYYNSNRDPYLDPIEDYEYKDKFMFNNKNVVQDVLSVDTNSGDMTKIAIFYHVYQYGEWESVFKEQIDKLKKSGLFDEPNFIHIGVNGEEMLPLSKEDYERIDVIQRIYGEDKIQGEVPTMRALYDFCKSKQEKYNVLFLHAKGVTWSKNEKKRVYYSSIEDLQNIWADINNPRHKLTKIDNYANIVKWRNYMEFFLIEKWRTCVRKLNVPSLLTIEGTMQTFDTAGTEWTPYFYIQEDENSPKHENYEIGYYSGGMWWANSTYIKQLNWDFITTNDDLYKGKKEGRRFLCEAWIGTAKPIYYNFHNSNKDLYIDSIEEYEYRNRFMLNNKNTATNGRICMVSMFKNEAAGIGRMLESVTPYIDFWVLQDNGSTDGTPKIVEEWAKKYNIPGFMYKCEEGWVGYGWNRDHVLQKALKATHNCDWIMKMDCDEALEIDDDFNWNELNNHSVHALSVYAKAPGCQYFRTWVWRSDLPWRINHDPAHETVYLENEYGHNYNFNNLGLGFKMLAGGAASGALTGESHQNPAKYALDALKLEEKLIRENSMLENMYHFFYIGKSYEDAMPNVLPLGQVHNEEMARRTIFYSLEWLDKKNPGFKQTHSYSGAVCEMGYYLCNVIGRAYRLLGEHYKAIEWFEKTEQFCPEKNDHLVNLAEIYWELTNYKKMLEITTRLMQPERTNPFPRLTFAISTNYYHDTGNHVQLLHNTALELNDREKFIPMGSIFEIGKKPRKKLWVVDNFYEDPHGVRKFALEQQFHNDLRFYKGQRTDLVYHTPQIMQRFEEIMGVKIRNFPGQGTMNGVFQFCTPEDMLVHHHDAQTWAAMVFLTPDAPFETGTSFYRHKETGITLAEQPNSDKYSMHGFYDRTKFELIDQIGNVFNRLVIFDARCLHSATQYFGTKKEDARLFHIFFFD